MSEPLEDGGYYWMKLRRRGAYWQIGQHFAIAIPRGSLFVLDGGWYGPSKIKIGDKVEVPAKYRGWVRHFEEGRL